MLCISKKAMLNIEYLLSKAFVCNNYTLHEIALVLPYK